MVVVRVSLAQEMQQDRLTDRVLQKSEGGFPVQGVGKDSLLDRVFRVLAQPQHHFAVAVVRVSLAQGMGKEGLSDKVFQNREGGFPSLGSGEG